MSARRLFPCVLAALLAAGCAPRQGGGGGAAPSATAAPNPRAAQVSLSDAFVSTAQVYADLVKGDYQAARQDESLLRRQLDAAAQVAPLSTRQAINRLEAQAIVVETRTAQNSPAAPAEALKLTEQFFAFYNENSGMAQQGGGAGTAPAK